MKKLFLASLLFPFLASSQITITENDMPSVGNEFINTNCVLDFTIDLNETGANHSWDYSNVEAMTTVGDTFVSIISLPFTYWVFLISSNMADKGGIDLSFGGYGLEDVYTFYNNASDQFEIAGYGGTLSGLEIPIGYGLNATDILYRFPLDYFNKDSSDASLSFSIPNLFSYSQQRHRVNEVDGWGTIKTPIGTFNALRVKSTITDVDSFYLDTLGFGYGITLKSYEYKWLAQNGGTPVFQMVAQDAFGIPVLSSVQYQDTTFHTGINEVVENSGVKIFPNPANDFIQIFFSQNQLASVYVYDAMGKLKNEFTDHHSLLTLDVSHWQTGMYFIHVVQNEKSFTSSFLVNH